MPAKSKPTVDDTARGVTERLRLFYLPTTFTDRSSLSKVSRRLFRLAEVADLKDPRGRYYSERHMLYAEAVALGFEHCTEAKRLRQMLAACEEWLASLSKPRKEEKKARPKDDLHITITRDCLRCVGLLTNDVVTARASVDLKPGDVGGVRNPDTQYFNLGRIVAVTPTHITLKDDESEFTRSRSLPEWIRIDHKNPTRADPLTSEQRGRVEVLQEKLEALGGEDDQILRCTAGYKLEKEIYDIEHPPADSDDWGAWEEKGGEADV
ncbi:MAG: hypothetical protein ACJ74Q_10475 [Pyrinomonadaceae bacterium]